MARRRASRLMCGLGNRVNRTPSGLPLCSTCHKELGFCTHSSLSGESSQNAPEGPAAVPAAAAAAGEQGTAAAPDKESVPRALAMNGRRKSRDIEALQDFLQPGKKRRRSANQDGALRKSKRRVGGILAEPKVGSFYSRQCTQQCCRGVNSSSVEHFRVQGIIDLRGSLP